jgi:hypothetical protein
MSVQGNQQAESVIRFINTKQVLLTATRLLAPASVFLQLEGATNEAITIDGGDVSKAGTAVAYKNGALEKAIRIRT